MPSSPVPKPTIASSRFVEAWVATLVLLAAVLFPLFTLVTLNWFGDRDANWIDQLYQRKARALATRPLSQAPRLLIFGGSATIFGVDAELIEKDLGIPTLNFATHGVLGFDYQISRIKRSAKENDRVLFMPELEAYGETGTPNDGLRRYAFTYDKRYLFSSRETLRLLFLTPYSDYVDSITRWNERLGDFRDEDLYTTRHGYGYVNLSPNGDMRSLGPTKTVIPAAAPNVFSPHAKESLLALHRWCLQRNIALLISWPNRIDVPNPDYQTEFQIHHQVAQFCQEQKIPVVGPPEESVYPKELFIDTVYHLNEIGRRIRTEKLIRDLPPFFGRSASPPNPEKTLCVLASRTPLVNQMGIFEKTATVDYKYLTATPLGHPDCISPEDLLGLVRSGTRVTCIDDVTEEMAVNAGLRAQEIKRRETSLFEWIARYDHHLFLMTLVGTDQCPVAPTNLPKYFAQFVSEKGFRIGMIGTGRLSAIHRISSNPDTAKWSRRRFDPLAAPTRFNFQIALRSGPVSIFEKSHPPIVVEGESHSALTSGLAVAVLDPDLGIAVAQGTFQSDTLLEWKLRELTAPVAASQSAIPFDGLRALSLPKRRNPQSAIACLRELTETAAANQSAIRNPQSAIAFQ